ncbi:MAG TPA: hypothetical protein VNI54_03810 [Thermoanaerobaculia bacterium]|nr:hypothetical protein [Thermoanaerobaculia bacterium]
MSRVVCLFAVRFFLITVIVWTPVAPAAAEQLSTSSIDWDDDRHSYWQLEDGTFTLHVCKDHFPPGSKARDEIDTAVKWYNRVQGAAFDISVAGTAHKSISELYEKRPDRNYFDYVDNGSEKTACKDAGATDWTMSYCNYFDTFGWSGLGDIKFFTIAANSRSRSHDTNPSADDYPKASEIAQTLAYVFGITSTILWPDSDQGYVSTVQGNLDLLSTYDQALLRHFYPGPPPYSRDLVVSPRIRKGSSTISWEEANPDQLFPDGEEFYDCATGIAPVFRATWFNTGTLSTGGNFMRMRIGPKGDESAPDKVTLWTKIASVPASSQESMTLTGLRKDAVGSLEFGMTYRLTFKLDVTDIVAETRESDNVQGKDIILRSSRANCH